MISVNIYRVRFIQSQRYAINVSAPSAALAEFFPEEIRKRAGTGPFEIGEPFSGDWQPEEDLLGQHPRPPRRRPECARSAQARRPSLDH
jgi:hypothetical protein